MAAVSFLREPERWREEIEKCRRRQESDIKSLLGKRREEEREREHTCVWEREELVYWHARVLVRECL